RTPPAETRRERSRRPCLHAHTITACVPTPHRRPVLASCNVHPLPGRELSRSEQRTHNPPVVGSSPTRPTCSYIHVDHGRVDRVVDRVALTALPLMSWQ